MKQQDTKAAFSMTAAAGTEGGGTEGATATITEIEFVSEFTYGQGGQNFEPSAALRVVFDIDGFDKPWEQHYSVGKSKAWSVTDKGNSIEPVGKATGFNKGSNVYRFLSAAEEAIEKSGLDLDDFHGSGSIEGYEGKRVVLTNLRYTKMDGDEAKNPLIIIASFLDDEAPVRGKGGKSNPPNGKPKGKNAEAALSEKADQMVAALLEDTPKLKRGDLATLVFNANKKDPDVKAVMQLMYKDAWVGSEDRPFEWDRKKNVVVAIEPADDDEDGDDD